MGAWGQQVSIHLIKHSPLYIGLAVALAAGLVTAFVYEKIGWLGLVLSVLPIGLVWYSFQLYVSTLENVQRTNQELKAANERLNVMYELSRLLASSLHVEDVLNNIQVAIQLLGFPAALVAGPLSAGQGQNYFQRVTDLDWAQDVLSQPHTLNAAALGKRIQAFSEDSWFLAGEPYTLDTRRAKPRTAPRHSSSKGAQFPVVTFIPLSICGERWGIVGVGTANTPSESQLKELSILRAMAEDALGMALAHEQAERNAQLDAVTGLYNHRYFQAALETAIQETRQDASCLSLLMIDINHFKAFNDLYGHQVGDQVLRVIAEILRTSLRGRDIACRYGGDEFSILLPDTQLAGAIAAATRLDQAIRNYAFHARQSDGYGAGESYTLNLSASIGIAMLADPFQTRADLIEQADRACYQAKTFGGGVVAAGEQAPINRASTPVLDTPPVPDHPIINFREALAARAQK